ncbi:MAG: dinitrogenase iron-molybdenum cofactor biosynthesis protein, partial [Candidatus Thermoplasmatota archaeon]|nr:dinitrogenase iron-molybdenum cofactor biosynthesis protein [Candidatus Thermoplasmatota archaeon]
DLGRAPTYTIIDIETNEIEILQNTSDHRDGACHPTEFFSEKGITTLLLCQDIGYGALSKLIEQDITVYTGANGQVKDALAAFKEHKLLQASMDTACSGHGHHQCHCGHD